MTRDDLDALREIAASYQNRADEFDANAARYRERLNSEEPEIGLINSRDLMLDLLGSYERRAHQNRQKAAVVSRAIEALTMGHVDG